MPGQTGRFKHTVWMSALISCLVSGSILLPSRMARAEELPAEAQAWLAPQTWTHDVDHPVISLGEAGNFDDQHVLNPLVVRMEDQFWMWYSGSRATVIDRVFKLGVATSKDGQSFRKAQDNPHFEFGNGRNSILTPTMLRNLDGSPQREAGKFRMWFSSTDFHDQRGLHTLHETSSEEGLRWAATSPALLEHVYAPTILREEKLYRLWYVDVSGEPWVIRHASSPDGRDWSVTEKPVLVIDQQWEQGRLFYPHVVKVEGLYAMWYGSYWSKGPNMTAIGFAVSTDGLVWHKHAENPVIRPEPKHAWESHYTTSHSVLRLADGSWRMWFATRTKPPHVNKYFAIGTARWAGLPQQK